jgi:hypothetical protein
MEAKTLVKIAIVVVIALVIWKKGIPWWQEHHGSSSTVATATSPGQDCASAAAAASETWGSGVGRFANPPYDMSAWDDFRSRVEQQARRAQEQCLCGEQSCTTAKGALGDLRSLVNEMDQSLRSGSPPPSDLVQRQEAIDNAINSARDLVKQGK